MQFEAEKAEKKAKEAKTMAKDAEVYISKSQADRIQHVLDIK